MREILFRGKLAASGAWSYGCLKIFPDKTCAISPDDTLVGKYGRVDPATVGQYTGLTDKNGVKIFEGDVLRYGETIHRAVFEQRNGTAYFGLVYGSQETLPFGHYQDLRQLEVIGNIHDNPELLKEEAEHGEYIKRSDMRAAVDQSKK